MIRYQAMIVMLLCSFSLSASELPRGLKPVGEASLNFLWYEVYHARLFNMSGRYQGVNAPLVLQLQYKRDIGKDVLLEQTAGHLQGKVKGADIQRWLVDLERLWPDVSKGDQLVFYMRSADTGYFFYNGELLGDVEHPGFARAFINIWLADGGRFTRMAKQLRGEAG